MDQQARAAVDRLRIRQELNNNRELLNVYIIKGAVWHKSTLGQNASLEELCFAQITFKV